MPTNSISFGSLLLQEDVYVCFTGRHYVFLDLHTDKYTCIAESQARLLAPMLRGESSITEITTEATLNSDTSAGEDIAYALMGQGLLTEDPNTGKEISKLSIEVPSSVLRTVDNYARPSIRAHHILNFFRAAIDAKISLRNFTIRHVVRKAQRRKLLNGIKNHFSTPRDKAQDLVGIFNVLRPFFPANYLCLFDSLSMLNFLAYYRVYPTWVFGVQTEPWSAHCWVQAGSIVYNDSVERTEPHTPIMAI